MYCSFQQTHAHQYLVSSVLATIPGKLSSSIKRNSSSVLCHKDWMLTINALSLLWSSICLKIYCTKHTPHKPNRYANELPLSHLLPHMVSERFDSTEK